MKKSIATVLLLLMTGCATVPATNLVVYALQTGQSAEDAADYRPQLEQVARAPSQTPTQPPRTVVMAPSVAPAPIYDPTVSVSRGRH